MVASALASLGAFLAGSSARTSDDRRRRGRFIRSVLNPREVLGSLPGLPTAELMTVRRVAAGLASLIGAAVGFAAAATAPTDTTDAWLFASLSVGLAAAVLFAGSASTSTD
jgi:hypothetical protein